MGKQEKKIKYEKPELVDLAKQVSVWRARGMAVNCTPGNSAGLVCVATGTSAGTGCAPTGVSPT